MTSVLQTICDDECSPHVESLQTRSIFRFFPSLPAVSIIRYMSTAESLTRLFEIADARRRRSMIATPKPGFADRFGDDRIESGLVQQAHHMKQPDRRLREFAAAGAERFDRSQSCSDIGAVVLAAVTEQAVFLARLGFEILRIF